MQIFRLVCRALDRIDDAEAVLSKGGHARGEWDLRQVKLMVENVLVHGRGVVLLRWIEDG